MMKAERLACPKVSFYHGAKNRVWGGFFTGCNWVIFFPLLCSHSITCKCFSTKIFFLTANSRESWNIHINRDGHYRLSACQGQVKMVSCKWAASRKKVPYGLSGCHSKRRAGAAPARA